MKLTGLPSPSNRRQSQFRRGFTLVEMMVALMSGMIILGAIVWTSITLTRSMVAISNYYQLDVASRQTLDAMSRDVRNASVVTSFSSNSLSMTGVNYQGVAYSFTYSWDGSNMWRTFTINTNTAISLMLSNCNYFAFENYTRVPSTNFTFNAAGSTNETKLINVTWNCTRSILGAKLNSESLQTAKIVIRN